MGLDAYELLLDFEESFDVKIADDRAAQVRTVGDLYGLISRDVSGIKRRIVTLASGSRPPDNLTGI